jgi:phosphohistidine swiveling domain-containing protein
MAEASAVHAPTGFVLDLADIDASMLPAVGGKAANLGELTRAQLPVPPGLCVTTEAYERVAAGAGVDDVLAVLAGTPPDDVAALTALAGRVRAALLAAPVPAPVTEAIASGYARLGGTTDVPVAVRSSATAEDLPFASFAGQQDTYLDVVGRDAVLDAVVRCWASLWTDRAVVYRATNGIDHRAVRLAVVIQRMVAAEVAGVLFTADPVTGRRRQAVIDASPGLGEAVVSGAVNPDHFVVDTATGRVVSRRLGDKRLVIRAAPGGGTEQVERPATGEACMTDVQLRGLAALGELVESHYGRPQDIEWAIDADRRLWLTQARPITNLYPLPETTSGNDLRVYFCFSVAQGVYRPITPLGRAAFRLLATSVTRMLGLPVADPLAGPSRYAEAGQRLFVDVTPALRSRIGRAAMPLVLDVMEARSAAVLRGLFDEPRLSVTRTAYWPVLRRVLRVAARYNAPLVAGYALARPEAAIRRFDRIGGRLEARLTLPASAAPAERLDLAERVLAGETVPLAPRILPVAAAGFLMFGLAGWLLGADARPGDLQTVLRGLPNNITTEMDLELWRLASRVRADVTTVQLVLNGSGDELAARFHAGTLPPAVQDGLTDFLHRYGHRAVAEIDIGLPRWSEDPRHVLGVLANYLRLDDPTRAPDAVFARGASEAAEMIETLVGRAKRRSRLRAGLVRFALRRTRQLVGVRELPKYYLVLALAGVRRQLMMVGADLARRGLIAAAGDVSYLDLRELRGAGGDLKGCDLKGSDLKSLVAARREPYETELRRRHVPRVLLSDGTEPEQAASPAGSGDGLVGTPASAGTVTGTARVVLDPVGAHLEPGEILVAPSTDPGWTPLFLTAGGLVMEMGGANSHGAVVAREYGIPAVVGVPDATARIRTGQEVTVDGSAGTVTVS